MDEKYIEDEHLLSEIKTGDEQFVRKLFQSYWGPFKGYANKLYDLSEEEVSEIYTRAFTTFYFNIKDEKLVAPLRSKLATYLFGIGRNYIRKHFEKKQKELLDLHPDLQEVQEHFQQPDIVDYFELKWQKRLVEELLNELKASCRKILVLSFIDEYSDEAIKEEMGIPSTNAVRQRRFNCLEKLRKLVRQKRLSENLKNP